MVDFRVPQHFDEARPISTRTVRETTQRKCNPGVQFDGSSDRPVKNLGNQNRKQLNSWAQQEWDLPWQISPSPMRLLNSCTIIGVLQGRAVRKFRQRNGPSPMCRKLLFGESSCAGPCTPAGSSKARKCCFFSFRSTATVSAFGKPHLSMQQIRTASRIEIRGQMVSPPV